MICKPFKDLSLSTLGMGTMRLPVKDGKIDREKAREMLLYAYEHGINYFDTAYRYHGGESESFVGEVLSTLPRDSYYLASKMPGHMMNYVDGKLGFQGYLAGFHVDSIADIFEEQLKKCKTDHFDFYLLHNVCESSYDFYTNEELDVIGYLLKQKEAGRIRHLGFSSHGRADIIDRFLTKYEGTFEFVQIQLNYLDWRLQQAKDKYDVITRHGLPVIVMEPVRGGRLCNLPESAEKELHALRPEATPAEWALRFLQSLPGVQVTLSGMTTMEQLQENIATFSEEKTLSEEEFAALSRAAEQMADFVPCTACRYCTEECPKGLDIPKLIAMYNEMRHDGAGTLSFNLRGMKDEEKPGACIGCGRCQRICPQGIHIPEIMRDFKERLGN